MLKIKENFNNITFYPQVVVKKREEDDFITDATFKVIDNEPVLSYSLFPKNLEERILGDLEEHVLLFKNSSSKKGSYLTNKIRNFKGIKENDTEPKTDRNPSLQKSDYIRLREKVITDLNKNFFNKLINKEENIIKSLAGIYRKKPDFLKKVFHHISALPSKQKLKNKSSLKGLMFDHSV